MIGLFWNNGEGEGYLEWDFEYSNDGHYTCVARYNNSQESTARRDLEELEADASRTEDIKNCREVIREARLRGNWDEAKLSERILEEL